MDLIKNKNLKQWVNENYPSMHSNSENDLCELNYFDMEKFADWLQEKVKKETTQEVQNKYKTALYRFGFKQLK